MERFRDGINSFKGTERLRYGTICGTELGQRYGTVAVGMNSVNGTEFCERCGTSFDGKERWRYEFQLTVRSGRVTERLRSNIFPIYIF